MINDRLFHAACSRARRRFKPHWTSLRASFAAERESGKGVDFVGIATRMQSLANKEADAVIASIRPFLLPLMTVTPGAAQIVNRTLAERRAVYVSGLCPPEMTPDAVAAKLADAATTDAEINDIFAAALEDSDEH